METLARAANRGSISTGPYEIENSCYFDSTSSHSMYFTAGSVSSVAEQRKGTFSFWLKRTKLGMNGGRVIGFGETDGYSSRMFIRFLTADTMHFYPVLVWTTERVFKDPSAWYHIVIMYDTTQNEQDPNGSSDTNHAQDPSTNPEGGSGTAQTGCWINGVRLGNDNGLPHGNTIGRTKNSGSGWGANTEKHAIGYDYLDSWGNADFYIAEFHAIQELAVQDPDDFGEFNDDGVWIPKKYTGTAYGTNGFYLKFDNAADMGNDSSSEGNDFTLVNMDSTNQMTDTPTNNFCTLNPNDMTVASSYKPTIGKGNLKYETSGSGASAVRGTMGMSKGKWYWEVKMASSSSQGFGVAGASAPIPLASSSGNGFMYYTPSGDAHTFYINSTSTYTSYRSYDGSNSNSASSFNSGTTSAGDIMMCAFDADNGKLYLGKAGSWTDVKASQDPASGASAAYHYNGEIDFVEESFFLPHVTNSYNQDCEINFGNPSFSISSGNADANGYGNFEYAVPSGFYALCTKNLAEYG